MFYRKVQSGKVRRIINPEITDMSELQDRETDFILFTFYYEETDNC